MCYKGVLEIVEYHIRKYEKILKEEYGEINEHPSISLYNWIISELKSIREEIIILEKVENSNNSPELVEIIGKTQLNNEFIEILKGLLNDF